MLASPASSHSQGCRNWSPWRLEIWDSNSVVFVQSFIAWECTGVCGAVIAWEKGCRGRERGSVIRVCGTGIAWGKAATGRLEGKSVAVIAFGRLLGLVRGKIAEGAWWHNRMPESYGMFWHGRQMGAGSGFVPLYQRHKAQKHTEKINGTNISFYKGEA